MLGRTPRFHLAKAVELRILFNREERIFSLVILFPLEILRSPGSLPLIAINTLSRLAATQPTPDSVIRHPFFLSPSTSEPYLSFRRSVTVTLTQSTSGYFGYLISPKRSGYSSNALTATSSVATNSTSPSAS